MKLETSHKFQINPKSQIRIIIPAIHLSRDNLVTRLSRLRWIAIISNSLTPCEINYLQHLRSVIVKWIKKTGNVK